MPPTSSGAVVVYRNRTDDEIRDIWIAREVDGWAQSPVGDDGWRLAGCPVNGPAVAAVGDTVVVAWFSAANDQPVVRAAVSHDAGATFSAPLELDGERPLGRVDVALDGDTAWIGWLARGGEGAAVAVRPLQVTAGGHRLGSTVTLAATGAARSSGFPRLAVDRGRLVVAWVDTAEGTQILTGSMEL